MISVARATCPAANGRIVAQGTPAELRASTDPLVMQFVGAHADGPVHFHQPAVPVAQDFGLGVAA